MTKAESVVSDYREMLDIVNRQSISISEKSLQAIAQSLLSISVTLAQILDVMTSNDAEGDE